MGGLQDIQERLLRLGDEADREERIRESKNALSKLIGIIKKHVQIKGEATIKINLKEVELIQGIGREICREYICGDYSTEELVIYEGKPKDFQEALQDGIDNIKNYFKGYNFNIKDNKIKITEIS